MDPEQLIGQVIGGLLGGKQKRRRGGFGLSDLMLGGGSSYGGRTRGGGLINAGTLLTVGGLIWGALETMQNQGSQAGAATPSSGSVPPSAPSRGVMTSMPPSSPAGTPVAPPPLPPPIPGAASASGLPPVPIGETSVPASLLPLVQLAVSAARADGDLSDDEMATIRARAGELGAAALVDAELQARRPIDSITPAFTTPEQRQMAYALAWAVVHGEGAVSPGERMYLTQLSRLLALPHEDIERIERETLSGGDLSGHPA